jgi:hypothetical protein
MEDYRKINQGLKLDKDTFITIDDLIPLATRLSQGLHKLGEYKYPLDVRRGVRSMNSEKESITIKAVGRMYFLDVKETKDGNPYLIITESRSKSEGKERERASIFVFQENLREFSDAIAQMADKLGL